MVTRTKKIKTKTNGIISIICRCNHCWGLIIICPYHEANVDEAIPIDVKKERNTQAYKDTLDIDIENISIFEKRNKVNAIKWRPIY